MLRTFQKSSLVLMNGVFPYFERELFVEQQEQFGTAVDIAFSVDGRAIGVDRGVPDMQLA